MAWRPFQIACVSFAVVLAGCAGPGEASRSAAGEGASPRVGMPKRLTIGIMADPKALGLVDTGPLPGRGEVEELLNSSMSVLDNRGVRRPQLAETIPSVENGLWKVFPDGRMETTWRIRSRVEWHDGAPFTSQDLLLATTIDQDRDLAVRRNVGYNAIESIDAGDPLTITVKWKRIFLNADAMFARGQPSFALPLPKHLLERTYVEDKGGLLSLPFWTEGYIGTGPFRMREWATGSHLLLEANGRYVLGQPKIDEIEVKFIPDQNTLIANILAGVVQLTMGRGISLEQATHIQGRWDGAATTAAGNPTVIFPKLTTPVPDVLTEVSFRRALLHAIDRQQLVDTFLQGLAPIAHPVVRLTDEQLGELQGSVVRYEHDPRKAAQLIEGLGYRRGTDGFFADANRQRLSLELTTDTSNDMQLKAQSVVANDWQRMGIGVETAIVPPQAQRESSWQWNFPGLSLRRNPINLNTLELYFHSGQIPVAENNFTGRNYIAYASRDLDGLIEQHGVTVPLGERMELARRIVNHITDQVLILGLFHDIEITLVGSRLGSVTGRSPDVGESWNAHEWVL